MGPAGDRVTGGGTARRLGDRHTRRRRRDVSGHVDRADVPGGRWCGRARVATADGLYALLAVVGGAALTGLIAGIAGPLRWASAVVLVAVAAGIAWSAIRDHRAGRPGPTAGDRSMTPTRAYGTLLGITLLGITLLNPATVIYFSALVVGSKATGAPTAGQGAVFVLAHSSPPPAGSCCWWPVARCWVGR